MNNYIFESWPSLAPYGKQMQLSGGTVFYYDCKKNTEENGQKPALVFIHGLGDEADTWRHILPVMCEKGFRCIALDLPGFGRSIWKGKINNYSQADAVVRLIDENKITGPVTLIGSSMGCHIVELAAFKKYEQVISIILIGGCFPMKGYKNMGMMLMCLPFIGKKWYKNFRKNHLGAWMSLYGYYKNLDKMPEEDKGFLNKRVIARVESDNQTRGYFASLRSIAANFLFRNAYFSKRIKKFRGNILMLWGEHDNVMPEKTTAAFRKLRPDSVFKTIAGAGHLPHQEKPEETLKEILSFLT